MRGGFALVTLDGSFFECCIVRAVGRMHNCMVRFKRDKSKGRKDSYVVGVISAERTNIKFLSLFLTFPFPFLFCAGCY